MVNTWALHIRIKLVNLVRRRRSPVNLMIFPGFFQKRRKGEQQNFVGLNHILGVTQSTSAKVLPSA